MNIPIRSAALGGRLAASWTVPSSAAAAPTQATSSPCRQKYPDRQAWTTSSGGSNYTNNAYQQKRPASTSSTAAVRSSRPASSPSLCCLQQQQRPTIPSLLAVIRSSTTALLPSSLINCRSFASASTSASSSSQQQSPSPSSSSSSSSSPVRLDWNTFFTLRASRRRYSLVSSILTALGTTSTGVVVLATKNLEIIGAQMMGLDPIAILVLSTAASGAVGWLAGPFLGNGLWRLVHRKYKDAVAVKEKEFYDRIKRFRVDPSAQSFSNPVPDYYGEKIGSVQGYRRWLKDQRAYNRKKRSFVV